MRQLQDETGTAILFVTHNLGVVAEIAERVVVMYAGRVVEESDARTIFKAPKHPYTKGLLASMPRLDRDPRDPSGRLGAIPGNVPSPTRVHRGCAFAPRCPLVIPACEEAPPPLLETAPGHRARCIRWRDV